MSSATFVVSLDSGPARDTLKELRAQIAALGDNSLIDASKLQAKVEKALEGKEYGIKVKLAESSKEMAKALEDALSSAAKNGSRGGKGHVVNLDWSVALGKLPDKIQSALDGHRVELDVSPSALRESLAMAVHTINTDTAALLHVKVGADREELVKSIAGALSHKFDININDEGLTNKVAAAVSAGTGKPHQVGVGGVTSHAQLDPATLATTLSTTLTQALTPSIDRMALSVADALKVSAVSSGRGGKAGVSRFSLSRSAKRSDGSTIRMSQGLEAEEAALELQTLETQKMFTQGERARLNAWLKAREEATKSLNVTASYLEMGRQAKAEAASRAQAQIAAEQAVFAKSERARLNAWLKAREEATKSLNVTASYLEMGRQAKAEAQLRLTEAGKRETQVSSWRVKSAPKLNPWDVIPGMRSPKEMGDFSASLKAQMESATPKKSAKDIKAWVLAANDAHSAARGLAGSLGMLWLTWGSTVPIAAMAALGGTIRSVIQGGKDLEYQLKFVAMLTGETTVSFKDFANAVRGSLVAPQEAAEAMRGLAQNGLSAKEALGALPDVLNLATAGEMSLAEAALGATGVMAAFNLHVTDIGRVGDVFAKAAAMSNTSVQSMVNSMRQASVVGDQFNVSLEETSAVLATMAKRNIIGTAAGTAFRNMMVELATPTEKAKRSMKALGLELYDQNNQLRGFGEILADLKGKTAELNEKGRLTFLNELFGERGAKAANALMSDYKLFNEVLLELKENAAGFSKELVMGLQSTVQGKWRALISEFQISTGAAFDDVKTSVGGVVDTLRNFVATDEFKRAITSITNGVLALTRAVMDHGGKITTLALMWTGLRMLMGSLTALLNLKRVAMDTLTASTRSLTLAMGGLSAAFGWISLLGMGAYTIWQAVKASDKLTQAVEARTEAQKSEERALIQGQDQFEKRIKQLQDETEALLKGVGAIEAKTKAEENLQRTEAQRKVNEARAEADAAQARLNEKGHTPANASLAMQAYQNVRTAEAQQAAIEQSIANNRILREAERRRDSASALAAYNEKARERTRTNPKANLPLLSREWLEIAEKNVDPEALKYMFKEMDAAVSRSGKDFEVPKDPKSDRGDSNRSGRQLANAELQSEINASKRKIEALKDEYDFQQKLNDIKFPAGKYGDYVARILNEAAADEYYTAAIKRQTEAIEGIDKVRAKSRLVKGAWTEADEERYKDTRAGLEAEREKLRQKQNEDRALGQARSEMAGEGRAESEAKALADMNSKADAYIAKMRQAAEQKAQDPVNEARTKAMFDIQEQSRDRLKNLELEINKAMEARDTLATRLMSSGEADWAVNLKTLEAANEHLKNLRDQLDVQNQLTEKRATEAGDEAARLKAQSMTPEAGMTRFWKEFANDGESAADRVYKAMKDTTDKISDAFVEFVTTGKLNFKGLVQSILVDLLRLQAQKMFKSLLFNIASFAGGGFGTGNAYGNQDIGTYLANGGIMTSSGLMPLNRYSGGGIATSPQLAIFGEGRQNEAYVPLPDGRSIPVTMSGQGGNSGVQLSYSPVINIDSSTDRAQVAALVQQASVESNKQLLQFMRDRGMVA